MSLINQALKKAQNDRSPKRMPMTEGASGTAQQMTSSSTKGLGIIVGLVIGIIILFGIVAGMTFTLMQKDKPREIEPQTAQASPTTDLALSANQSSSANTEAPSETDALIEQLRAAKEAAEAEAAEAKKLAEEQAEKEAAEATAAAQAQKGANSAAIVDWLSNAQITGVRLSANGNKALINGKAFTVGELVHYGLGLTVIRIEESRVLFVDAGGIKYVKRL